MRLLTKIKTLLIVYHQQIANYFVVLSAAAAIIGVWLTFVSLKDSAKTVEQQLKEQKKATSVLIVSDFLTEVGAGIVRKKRDDIDFQKIVITRTQLLIDTLDFPDLKSQVIRFLGTNDFGEMFDSKMGSDGNYAGLLKSHIDLANADLSNGNLDNITLMNASLFCSNLNGVSLNIGKLEGSNIVNADLRRAIFEQSFLKNANIQWTNFRGAILNGDLTDATIVFSDLRGIKSGIILMDNRSKEVEHIVNTLKKAKTLYGSILDEDVGYALRRSVNVTQKRSANDLLDDVDILIGEKDEQKRHLRPIYDEQKANAEKNWERAWIERRAKYCYFKGET